MKILQINTTYNIGSTGRIVAGIENSISNSGGIAYTAFGYGDKIDDFHYKIINKFDSYSHNIFSRLYDKQGLFSSKKTWSLIQFIEKTSPDLVHLHNLHGNYLNYNILFDYLAVSDTKVIWTLHDCWSFTGHCAYFDLAKCNKWKTECVNCPQISAYPPAIRDGSQSNFIKKSKLFRRLGQNLILVPVSYWLADLIKDSFLRDLPVKVIHNGINTQSFKPQQSCDNHKPYIIGVASPWDKRKGLNDFIQLRKILSLDIDIKLVGLSSRQIASLPEGITGIHCTNSLVELAHLYSDALAFVNTTYEDNYPTVNMEAIACGVPVITYKTGGSPESVHKDCGFVINLGDLDAIRDIAEKLCNGNIVFSADSLHQYASEHFDEKRCFQSYVELYNAAFK
ncbi:MAG: glycosyltransferase [Lachnospiraceae bacterium]|nr:glycosyltransferase [Lachnospiraceae bacterium]